MAQDVVDVIMQDHREVERLFEELRTKPEARAGIVPVLVTLLTAHERAEESVVYPAAREEAGLEDDVAHSQQEHLEADQLLSDLAEVDPSSPDFEPALQKVIDSISHHIEEEEESVLPGMRRGLSDERRGELAEAFLAERREHLGDEPDDITKDELRLQAENAEVSGTAGMSKEELKDELAKHAES